MRRPPTAGNHLGPVTATGGVNAGIVSVSHSIGEQVKEQSSDADGTRLETSKFEEGDLVTVSIPVDVPRHRSTRPRTRAVVRRRPRSPRYLPNVARAVYHVKMLKHDVLERLRQMEAGA